MYTASNKETPPLPPPKKTNETRPITLLESVYNIIHNTFHFCILTTRSVVNTTISIIFPVPYLEKNLTPMNAGVKYFAELDNQKTYCCIFQFWFSMTSYCTSLNSRFDLTNWRIVLSIRRSILPIWWTHRLHIPIQKSTGNHKNYLFATLSHKLIDLTSTTWYAKFSSQNSASPNRDVCRWLSLSKIR